MQNEIILKIAIPSPLRQLFDYLPPPDAAEITLRDNLIGARILVPFGRQEMVGFILDISDTTTVSAEKLKPAIKILDPNPLLTKTNIELLKWISNYYHHSIGEVIAKAFPTVLRNKPSKAITKKIAALHAAPTDNQISNALLSNHKLNSQQQAALNHINNCTAFNVFLLDGITGSGKTEVYLHAIEKVLLEGKQAIILIPEINLTPQTIERFTHSFPGNNIAVLHSRINPTEKLCAWIKARNGDAQIVIGTRSAIFTPLKNPGIIILDEEHDLSFKQQSDLRYSARDVAIMRGKLENIPVVLGSATPSLESIHNAKLKRYTKLTLSMRAGSAKQPTFHLVDMRSQKLKDGLAAKLIQAMEDHLNQDGQVLLFLNRRGYAPVMLCHQCGTIVDCKNCDAHLTMHRATQKLHCHHCNYNIAIPKQCKQCGAENLLAIGIGTERLENSLKHLFPGVSVIRVDSDTTRNKGELHKLIDQIKDGKNQILVGTQMLAKGHHFPNVTMVGILNADNGLCSPDFRASEHLAQMIIQVAGRAGRAERPGEVYIQTHNPQHPFLLSLINNGYPSFAAANLAERKKAHLPPFAYLALLRSSSADKELGIDFLTKIKECGAALINTVNNTNKGAISILGPVPSSMERKAQQYQAHLLFQTKSRKQLHELLVQLVQYINSIKPTRAIKWNLDIDPLEIFS